MKREKGLTLIELIIVVAIVGILTAVAIPVYTGYSQRARRADAKTALLQLRAAEETFRAENGAYTNNFALLNANWGGPRAVEGEYALSLAAGGTATTFTGQAVPNTPRQQTDNILVFFINQDNRKWTNNRDGLTYDYPNPKSGW